MEIVLTNKTMETKNEILRICNDGKVFLHGKLVDKKDVKEVLSTLVNYVPEQELEEELPKKGQIVWGSNNEGEKWCIGHFIKKEFNEYMISYSLDEGDAGKFSKITTKNPYEVEEDREPQIGDICYFWACEDTPSVVISAELANISSDINQAYKTSFGGLFKHCSLKNPLIK